MYDPTIFENLKVAFENHVYDLDNLERKIDIKNRVDQMDLSIIARTFKIEFTLVDQSDIAAEIILDASLEDLAGEILEIRNKNIGCTLALKFNKNIQNPDLQCEEIEQAIKNIWEDDIVLTQTLSFEFGTELSSYTNTIEVRFTQKINEDQISDLEMFLEHVLETLDILNKI
ncbi:hypothetical protein MKY29_18925 [Psychrobacillus sp. FSL K6-2365]|uniref:hypothetical protein n=1 Tax=Psychrobacillus TaxID=1221880 RepID=UPI0008E7A882|nr:hypothetical protein [Psychrobacillus psychrodurans]MCZ8541334.1 hypothetical protein [Psychrobacillus psychrodurans]SFM96483.1 hypothetical protein SAMN05421832_11027 [Psychrobacillus psychrodurans]